MNKKDKILFMALEQLLFGVGALLMVVEDESSAVTATTRELAKNLGATAKTLKDFEELEENK